MSYKQVGNRTLAQMNRDNAARHAPAQDISREEFARRADPIAVEKFGKTYVQLNEKQMYEVLAVMKNKYPVSREEENKVIRRGEW